MRIALGRALIAMMTMFTMCPKRSYSPPSWPKRMTKRCVHVKRLWAMTSGSQRARTPIWKVLRANCANATAVVEAVEPTAIVDEIILVVD
jgi:hypothetical protein